MYGVTELLSLCSCRNAKWKMAPELFLRVTVGFLSIWQPPNLTNSSLHSRKENIPVMPRHNCATFMKTANVTHNFVGINCKPIEICMDCEHSEPHWSDTCHHCFLFLTIGQWASTYTYDTNAKNVSRIFPRHQKRVSDKWSLTVKRNGWLLSIVHPLPMSCWASSNSEVLLPTG